MLRLLLKLLFWGAVLLAIALIVAHFFFFEAEKDSSTLTSSVDALIVFR